eukprot:4840017-Alexandrium_andersonii.AAC.1
MSASLVGSEMCIRDSARAPRARAPRGCWCSRSRRRSGRRPLALQATSACLLYTSDAADDM